MDDAINPFAKPVNGDTKPKAEQPATDVYDDPPIVEYLPIEDILKHVKLSLKSCGTNKAEQDRTLQNIKKNLEQYSKYHK